MSWELIFVLALLLFAVVSFIMERWPVDVTAIVVFSALLAVSLATGSALLPDQDQILNVFANSAPLTIAAMFILSAALDRCGVIEQIANGLERLSQLPYALFIVVMVFSVAIVSAFVNNTPVVVVFMPVIISLARKMDTPASKMLIPLSYASIFGGVCTLMGTSTNILISEYIRDRGHAPIGMFEISWVGLPLLFVGAAYLAIFGKRLLPTRETLMSILSEDERKEFISEAFIRPESHLIGSSFDETILKKEKGLRLLELIRDGVAIPGAINKVNFMAGDRLVLSCRASALANARKTGGVHLVGEEGMDLEQIAAHEGAIVEGIIGPRSSIAGQTIEEINFRQRYRMVLLAVHRNGRNVRDKLATLRFNFGDTLLMMGTEKGIENLRASDDIILLDRPALPAQNMKHKRPLVIATIAAMVLAVSFNIMPIVAAAIMAVAVFLATGVLTTKQAYNSIEWRILILIYGMLGLSQALETTGITGYTADALLYVTHLTPEHLRPFVVLALVYLCTSIFTEILSNNATVLLIAPVALALAATMEIDPRPLIIATCVAASASFSTPIGYQTNTYVYGVGGYRFSDFYKIGIPMNLVYFAASMAIIPLIWPF